jgi:hypothetical protein
MYQRWMRFSRVRMRVSRAVWASCCQCQSRNSPGVDPSVLPHCGIWGAADEAVLNNVHKKKKSKKSPFNKINKCTLFSAMDPLLPLSSLEKGTASVVGAVPPAVAVKGTLAWHFLSSFWLRPQSTLCLVCGRKKDALSSGVADPWHFWYGSGSADPYLWLTHPDPIPDLAIFVSNWQLKIIVFCFFPFEAT